MLDFDRVQTALESLGAEVGTQQRINNDTRHICTINVAGRALGIALHEANCRLTTGAIAQPTGTHDGVVNTTAAQCLLALELP